MPSELILAVRKFARRLVSISTDSDGAKPFFATDIINFPIHMYSINIRGTNFVDRPKHWAVVVQTGAPESHSG